MVEKTDSPYEDNTGILAGGKTAEELLKASAGASGEIKTPNWIHMQEPEEMTTKKEYWVSVRIITSLGIIDTAHQKELEGEAKVEAWKGLIKWKTGAWSAENKTKLESLKIDYKKATATTAKKEKIWIDPNKTKWVYFLISIDKAAFDTAYKGYELTVDSYDKADHILFFRKSDMMDWKRAHEAAVKNLELYSTAAIKHQDQDGHDWKGIISRYKTVFNVIESQVDGLEFDLGLRLDFSKDYKLMACWRLPANPAPELVPYPIEGLGGFAEDFDQITSALIAHTFDIAAVIPNNAKQRSRFEFQTNYIYPFGVKPELELKFEAMEKGRLDHNQKVLKIQKKLGTTAFHGIMNDAVHRGYMDPEDRKDILDAQKDLVDFVGDAKVESAEEMCTPLKDIKSIYQLLKRYDLAAQARKRAGVSDMDALWNFFVSEYNSAKGAAKAAAKKNLDDFNAARKRYDANIKKGLHSIMTFRLYGKQKPVPHLLKGLLSIAAAAIMIMIKKAIVKEIKEKCKAVQRAFDEMKCAALDNEFMTDTRANMKKYGLFSMQSKELLELHRARDWETEGPRPDQDALRVALKQPLNSRQAQRIRSVTAGALQDLTPPQVCGMLARDEVPPAVYETIKTHLEADPELKGIFKPEDFSKVLRALKTEIKYSPPLVPPRPPAWCDVETESLGDAIAGRAPAELIAELEKEQEELQHRGRRKLLRDVFNLPPEDQESPEAIVNALMQKVINEDEDLNKTTTKFVDQLFDSLDISYVSEAQDLKTKLMKLTEMDPKTKIVTTTHDVDGNPIITTTFKTHLEVMQEDLQALTEEDLIQSTPQNAGFTVETPQGYTLEFKLKESVGTMFTIKIYKNTWNNTTSKYEYKTIFERSGNLGKGVTHTKRYFFWQVEDSLTNIFGKQIGDLSTWHTSQEMLSGVFKEIFAECISKVWQSPLFDAYNDYENIKNLALFHHSLEDNLFNVDNIKENLKEEIKELSATMPLYEAAFEAILGGSTDALSRLTVAENVFLNLFFLSMYPSLKTISSGMTHSFLQHNLKNKLAGRKTKITSAELIANAAQFQKAPFQKIFPAPKSFDQMKLEVLEERDVPSSYHTFGQALDYKKYEHGGLILERYARVDLPSQPPDDPGANFLTDIANMQSDIVELIKKDIVHGTSLSGDDLKLAKTAVNLSGVVNIHAWQNAAKTAIKSGIETSDDFLHFREIEIKHYKSNVWKKVHASVWLRDPRYVGSAISDKFYGGATWTSGAWRAKNFEKFFDIKQHLGYLQHGKVTFSTSTGTEAGATGQNVIGVEPLAPGMTPNPIKTLVFNVQAQEEDINYITPESQVRFHWYLKSKKELGMSGLSYISGFTHVPYLLGLRLSYVLPATKDHPHRHFLKHRIIHSPLDDIVEKLVKESALIHRTTSYAKYATPGQSPPLLVVIPLVSAETPPNNPLNFYETAKWFAKNYNTALDHRLYKMLAEEAKDILSMTSDPMFSLATIYTAMFTANKLDIDPKKGFSNTTDAIRSVYDAVDKVDEFNHETSIQKATKKKVKKQLLKGKK